MGSDPQGLTPAAADRLGLGGLPPPLGHPALHPAAEAHSEAGVIGVRPCGSDPMIQLCYTAQVRESDSLGSRCARDYLQCLGRRKWRSELIWTQ
jgi:hypothetical protein